MDERRRLTLAYLRAHPAEAAATLDAAPTDAVADLLRESPARVAVLVLAEMSPHRAAEALRMVAPARAVELIAGLGLQAAIRVLRHVPEALRRQVIEALPTATAAAIRVLLGFPRDSVGAMADPLVVAASPATSAADGLRQVRALQSPVDHVLLIDESKRLVGWVPLDALLRAPDSAPLGSLSRAPPASLPATMPLAGAVANAAWSAASVLPVVDRAGRLVGLLSHAALVRATARAARESAFNSADESLAGMLASSYLQSVVGLLQAGAFFLPRVPSLSGRRHGE
ncbi:MAG: hypothetical protein AB7Q97_18275 [Gammaproteobacteria bacterium]